MIYADDIEKKAIFLIKLVDATRRAEISKDYKMAVTEITNAAKLASEIATLCSFQANMLFNDYNDNLKEESKKGEKPVANLQFE